MSGVSDTRIGEIDLMAEEAVNVVALSFNLFPEEWDIFWEQVIINAQNWRRSWQIALK